MKVGVTGFRRSASAPCRCGSACRCSPRCCSCSAFVPRPRKDWRARQALVANMIVWHVLAILAVQALSSTRGILGYTMPIFSALWGSRCSASAFGRATLPGVGAGLGVALLLWHEFASIAGRPWPRSACSCRRALGARHAADATDDDHGADARDRLLDDRPVDLCHDLATAALRARALARAAPGRSARSPTSGADLRPGAADLADPGAQPAADLPRACR